MIETTATDVCRSLEDWGAARLGEYYWQLSHCRSSIGSTGTE